MTDDGTKLLIDMFFSIVFLLLGIATVIPALLPVGADVLGYIFSVQFLEFFTVMVGVLIVAKMVMWLLLGILFSRQKMGTWLYYLIETILVTIWIVFVMTSFFNTTLVSTLTNFIVLAALVFISGLLGPLVRMVLVGE